MTTNIKGKINSHNYIFIEGFFRKTYDLESFIFLLKSQDSNFRKWPKSAFRKLFSVINDCQVQDIRENDYSDEDIINGKLNSSSIFFLMRYEYITNLKDLKKFDDNFKGIDFWSSLDSYIQNSENMFDYHFIGKGVIIASS